MPLATRRIWATESTRPPFGPMRPGGNKLNMDWTFLLQLVAAIGIGIGILFVSARFSPDGTSALRSWKFWSFPIGAVTPGLGLVGSLIAFPEGSDHTALAVVLMLPFLGAVFFVGSLASLFLKRPAGAGWRFLLGIACNAVLALCMSLADM